MNIPKNCLMFLLVMLIMSAQPAGAADTEVMDEIKLLKQRIEQLEKKLTEQNNRISKQEKQITDHASDLEELDAVKRVVSDLEIDVDATSVVQGTINNDHNHKRISRHFMNIPDEGDDADATYAVDIEISSKIGDHGKALLLLEAGEGFGLNEEAGGFTGVNHEAYNEDADVEVAEVWYEHRFSNDSIILTVGKLDLTRWFDTNAVANDEKTQFLSSQFVNNIAVDWAGEWPGEHFTYGARLCFVPNDMMEINLGYVESDGDFEDLFDDNLYIGEVAFKPQFGSLKGNYRFYAWRNSSDHTQLKEICRYRTDDDEDEGWGMGVSFDQQLSSALTAFARFGYMDNTHDDTVYPLEMAWSLGFQVQGSAWGRAADMFGLAFGSAQTSDDYRDLVRGPKWNRRAFRRAYRRWGHWGWDTTPAENRIEAYYRCQVNKHLAISPDIQVVEGLAGFEDAHTVTIVGLRAHLAF